MDSAREVQHERLAVFSITPRGRQDTSRRSSRHVLLTDDGVRIEAEHGDPAAGGADQVKNQPDGGGLTGAVRAEEAEHLAALYF